MSKETNYDSEGIFFGVLLVSQEVLGKMNFEIFLSAPQEAQSWAGSLQDFSKLLWSSGKFVGFSV